MAEGSWMFILEDYDHARARGARIYAEIAATVRLAKRSTASA